MHVEIQMFCVSKPLRLIYYITSSISFFLSFSVFSHSFRSQQCTMYMYVTLHVHTYLNMYLHMLCMCTRKNRGPQLPRPPMALRPKWSPNVQDAFGPIPGLASYVHVYMCLPSKQNIVSSRPA